jgi:catechol 2,3-dioxygenase
MAETWRAPPISGIRLSRAHANVSCTQIDASALKSDDIILNWKPAAMTTVPEISPAQVALPPVDSRLRIGHVHLKVSDIERGLAFWRDAIGLEVQQWYGRQAVFLSAGGYHHHIALNVWESAGGQPPTRGTTGLFHVALLYPDRKALANALKRLLAHGVELQGASDHGVSEALYLSDFDGNGVELYRDREEAEWPRDAKGELAMVTRALDVRVLLAEAD